MEEGELRVLTGIPTLTIREPGELNPTTVTPGMDKAGARAVGTWVKKHVEGKFSECSARVSAASNGSPSSSINTTAGGSAGKPLAIHKVKVGDTLSKIAIQYYGQQHMMKYKKIHQANMDTIGPNANLIRPNQELIIPKLK